MHVNVNARAFTPTRRPEMPLLTTPHPSRSSREQHAIIDRPTITPTLIPRASSSVTELPLFPSCQAVLTYKVKFSCKFDWRTSGVLPGLLMSRQRAHHVIWNPGGIACVCIQSNHGYQVHEYGKIASRSPRRPDHDDVWLLNGDLKFIPDEWNEVALGIVMNSIGQSDGVLSLKINAVGKRYERMVWRSSPDSRLLGLAPGDTSKCDIEIKEVHIESRECTPIQPHVYEHPAWIISPFIQQWGLWVWGSGVLRRRVRTSYVHGSACVTVMYVAHQCGPNSGLNVYLPIPWKRVPIAEIHYDVFFPHGFLWNAGGVLFGLGRDSCPGWTHDGYVAFHNKRIGRLRRGSWNSIRVSRVGPSVYVDVNGTSGDDICDIESLHFTTVAMVSWHTRSPVSTMHAYFRNIRVF